MTPEEYFKKHYVNKSNGLLKPAKWVMEFADSYHKKQLPIHSVSDMFSAEQMEEAYTAGRDYESGFSNEPFRIENYR